MKKKLSKRYKNLIKNVDSKKINAIEVAIQEVKKNCTAKFNESIDVSFAVNLKQKKEEINLRTIVNLPNGNGKKIKVAVICEDEKLKEAKDSGADFFNSNELIDDIMKGKIKFDKLVATPTMMSKISKLGKILGPKGLMPNPKLGTVTSKVDSAVKSIKSGQIEIKNDKDGNIAASIGKKNFSDDKIKENYNTIFETISKEKPKGIKGSFITSAYLTSTMGPSYKLKLGK
tara:strand:- start:1453 stop:2142 length:690 start_codon:yes stop_codon:yes gene_type:complete